ncbi:MAG: CDP-diacylglycerol--glycerol-3-phosphate 3-phosphatidyltransferase [Tenericutes bacterium]|nr:CDP-diacylglycerol--glycerol-3-phosphate 3-phosphatidyltransferase [Mycoplasmatota bacterium]
MNLPNKLTVMRMICIPVIFILYFLRQAIGDSTLLIIGVLFTLASVTDFFDGYIARKRNIVTTFGKFMDPLADKLLVLGTLMILSDLYTGNYLGTQTMWMPFWIVFVILARELIVTSIRLVAVGEGKILHASKLGKYKTALTMVTIMYYLFIMPLDMGVINIIGIVLISLSVFMTLWSGLDYFIKNKEFILKEI